MYCFGAFNLHQMCAFLFWVFSSIAEFVEVFMVALQTQGKIGALTGRREASWSGTKTAFSLSKPLSTTTLLE
ncbi:MAG: hypothetical protein CO065_14440 [Comamonadaceae bacterium CG_4_9_14_0_8_um_filter_57_21]|nr:MAG: hypothetical protein AUK50_00945 [Comamonadaceae bacterium CG2_30_57_122]PIZ23460.1 MAG: hypothetical protein COY49_03210 [Comamonadaceae bacterium CG_4_10_14_0_8_um_filter_57_29]PJC14412.1 MAG: hypothetical protein CO065_14440 [Comamonadaceae bacterium CG_4_9_14_0_8_um_filter_57_21]